jgi:hypothetical protein
MKDAVKLINQTLAEEKKTDALLTNRFALLRRYLVLLGQRTCGRKISPLSRRPISRDE